MLIDLNQVWWCQITKKPFFTMFVNDKPVCELCGMADNDCKNGQVSPVFGSCHKYRATITPPLELTVEGSVRFDQLGRDFAYNSKNHVFGYKHSENEFYIWPPRIVTGWEARNQMWIPIGLDQIFVHCMNESLEREFAFQVLRGDYSAVDMVKDLLGT